MALSAGDAVRVRDSYAAIRYEARDYSELFYHRLLERHPFTRSLFPDDMIHQIEIFRQTIDMLVDQLDELSSLEATLASLARRHARYGVEARHYSIVGDILIETFAEMVGERFCAKTWAAWQALYAATAGLMIREAYPPGARGSGTKASTVGP